MDLYLQGKIAIVTGGASGMGATVGRMLAAEGVNVVLADIQDERGRMWRLKLSAAAATRHLSTPMSATAPRWTALVSQTIEQQGHIDILCGIAGPGASSGQLDTTEDEYNRQLDGHLRGVFNCTQAVLPPMMERRYGKIINMGVIHGLWRAWGDSGLLCRLWRHYRLQQIGCPFCRTLQHQRQHRLARQHLYAHDSLSGWISRGRKEAMAKQIPIGQGCEGAGRCRLDLPVLGLGFGLGIWSAPISTSAVGS